MFARFLYVFYVISLMREFLALEIAACAAIILTIIIITRYSTHEKRKQDRRLRFGARLLLLFWSLSINHDWSG